MRFRSGSDLVHLFPGIRGITPQNEEAKKVDAGFGQPHQAGSLLGDQVLDVSFNAIWILSELQGASLLEMPVADFTAPVMIAIDSTFLTATAAARQMVKQGSGAILLSTSSAGLSGRDRRFHETGGQSTATLAVEAFTRSLAGEAGLQGVRVVCLRPDALPETLGEHLEWEPKGEVWRYMEDGAALGRLPALAEVGIAAVFTASDWAGAMTGAYFKVTGGSIMN